MTDEDVRDVADILNYTRRTIPPEKWVDELRDAAADARNEAALKVILG